MWIHITILYQLIIHSKTSTMRIDTGPVLLILLGAFLLLSNLGILNLGDIKELFSKWWPALLIIIGIIQLRKRK